VDRVRALLHCIGKATADEWLDVMPRAPGGTDDRDDDVGTVETDDERVEHLLRLRDLRMKPAASPPLSRGAISRITELAGTEATGVDYLRTLALARIVLDNFDNLQASWVCRAAGRTAEPGLRRQRHGQRDDRGKRRSRRRLSCMDSRDRPQHRGCRLRGEAPQHALRATWRTDLSRRGFRACWSWRPRAKTATPRCPGAEAMPGAQPCRQAAPRHSTLIHYAAWIVPVVEPPEHDGWVTVDRGLARVEARSAKVARRHDLGDAACCQGW
jgi:hypothetical protein